MQQGVCRDFARRCCPAAEPRSNPLISDAGLEAILLSTIADGLGLPFGDDVSRIGVRNDAAQHPVAAYYQNGAVGAADDVVGGSANGGPPHRLADGPPHRARPPTTHDDQVRPDLVAHAYDLVRWRPDPQVCFSDVASGLADLLDLPLQQLPCPVHDRLVGVARESPTLYGDARARIVGLADVDHVQLRPRLVRQGYRRLGGHSRILRTVRCQQDLCRILDHLQNSFSGDAPCPALTLCAEREIPFVRRLRGDTLRSRLRWSLDRRQRSGDALQGLALGPHTE